jgi:DNA-binding MarR family transcriptional regulator
MLDRLEKAGYVTRSPTRASLTPKNQARFLPHEYRLKLWLLQYAQ